MENDRFVVALERKMDMKSGVCHVSYDMKVVIHSLGSVVFGETVPVCFSPLLNFSFQLKSTLIKKSVDGFKGWALAT